MLINQYFKRESPAKRTANLVIIFQLTKIFGFYLYAFSSISHPQTVDIYGMRQLATFFWPL